MSNNEDNSLLHSYSGEENLHVELEEPETMNYKDALLSNNSDMDVREVSSVYKIF